MAGAFHNMHIDDLIARALVTFCTFVPFFAFREVRRVLGEDKFQDLLRSLRSRTLDLVVALSAPGSFFLLKSNRQI